MLLLRLGRCWWMVEVQRVQVLHNRVHSPEEGKKSSIIRTQAQVVNWTTFGFGQQQSPKATNKRMLSETWTIYYSS